MGTGSKTEILFRFCTRHACKKRKVESPGHSTQSVPSNAQPNLAAAPSQPTSRTDPFGSAAKLTLGLIVMALLWVVPILACGSFQPRPTPTREVPVTAPDAETPVPDQPSPTAPPTTAPSPTETPVPSPTPTIVVRNPLTIGEQARISVVGGLNVRDQPTVTSPAVTLLAQGKRITVLEGPVSSDGYIWWKVDDSQGTVGWVAGGQGLEDWISPQVGDARPVDRPPAIGDQVIVTLNGELTVRALPGVGGSVVARVRTNETFTVVAGPQAADGYFWYQIRSDDGRVEGWAADGSGGERWLSPLE